MPASTWACRKPRALRRVLETSARIAKTAMKKMPQAIMTSINVKAVVERGLRRAGIVVTCFTKSPQLGQHLVPVGFHGSKAGGHFQKHRARFTVLGAHQDQSHFVAGAIGIKADAG